LPGIIVIIMPRRDGWCSDFTEIELERTPAAAVVAGFFIAAA
jgi:hypothetical protein